MDDNKQKALDLALKQIDKTFGKGAMGYRDNTRQTGEIFCR